MKKTIFILLLAVFSNLVSLFAQDRQQAFFVYRNDGDFNVFFFSSVDSITYSKIDVDSVLCEEYVTQEVWTEDSVFRIPTAAIDSVAFKPLPTIYKDNVEVIDKDLFAYVISVDSLTINFSSDLPKSMTPKIGQKLVREGFDDTFPNGFGGIVKSVSTEGGYIVVDCDSIGLGEIYEQYFYTTSLYAKDLAQEQSKARAIINPNSYFDGTIDLPSWSVDLNATKLEIEPSKDATISVGGNIGYTVDPSLRINYCLIFSKDIGNSFTLSVKGRFDYDIHAGISGSIELQKDFPVLKYAKPKIYLGGGTFFFIDPGFFVRATGDASFNLIYNGAIETYFYFKGDSKYKENQIPPTFTIKPAKADKPTIESEFKGTLSLSTGLFNGFAVTIGHEIIDKLEFREEGGINLEYSAKLPTSNGDFNTIAYEALKEQGLELSLYEGKSLDLDVFDFNYPLNLQRTRSITLLSKKFVPTFSNVKFDKTGQDINVKLSAQTSEEVLFPVKVGFAVYEDEDEQPIETKWYTTEYENPETFNEYEIDFDIIKANKKYTAYPVVEWSDKTLPAIPMVEISLTAEPITGAARNIKTNSALLSGRLDGFVDLLDENSRYGFLYSGTSDPTMGGITINCELGTDGTMSANVTDLKPGTTYYYCTFLYANGEYTYGIISSFETKSSDEIVDLGLSVKWRGWNVGATKPEDYGDYYAWGETETKVAYTWDTYFDNPYGADGSWVGSQTNSDISGTELDAATATLGPEWRMPTRDEMQELIDGCDWNWTQVNGVWGYEVSSRTNNNSIFLPAAGNNDGSSVNNAGQYGGYWTGTVGTSTSNSQAGNLYFFGKTLHAVQWSNRYMGRSIRPVTEQ